MKPIADQYIVRFNEMKREVAGILLEENASFSPDKKVAYVTVVQTPMKIRRFRPKDSRGREMSVYQWPDAKDIEYHDDGTNDPDMWFNPIVEIGDVLGVHPNAIHNKSHLKHFPVRPDSIFFGIRNGEMYCPGPYCIIEPIMESENDIKTASGLFIKSAPGRKQKMGIVKAKGFDPFGDAHDLNVGDKVMTDMDFSFIASDNKEYFRPRYSNILGKYN